jgi:hypothetical protein
MREGHDRTAFDADIEGEGDRGAQYDERGEDDRLQRRARRPSSLILFRFAGEGKS